MDQSNGWKRINTQKLNTNLCNKVDNRLATLLLCKILGGLSSKSLDGGTNKETIQARLSRSTCLVSKHQRKLAGLIWTREKSPRHHPPPLRYRVHMASLRSSYPWRFLGPDLSPLNLLLLFPCCPRFPSTMHRRPHIRPVLRVTSDCMIVGTWSPTSRGRFGEDVLFRPQERYTTRISSSSSSHPASRVSARLSAFNKSALLL